MFRNIYNAMRHKNTGTKSTAAERIAFLSTCIAACIAISCVAFSDCQRHRNIDPPVKETIADSTFKETPVIKKNKKSRKDSIRNARKKAKVHKNIAPKDRDYFIAPEEERTSVRR